MVAGEKYHKLRSLRLIAHDQEGEIGCDLKW